MFQEPVSLVMLMDDEPSLSHPKALSLVHSLSQLRHHKSAVGSLWVVTGLLSLTLTTNLWIQVGNRLHHMEYGALLPISLLGWGCLFYLLTACGWLECQNPSPIATHNTVPAFAWAEPEKMSMNRMVDDFHQPSLS